MNKQLNWGVIGCGKVTEVKSVPAYKQVKGFKVLAVMRRQLDLAKDYAQRHHIEAYYDDADALINNDNIDAIYIATPPDSHLHYALKVAKAGKICCIEKPMAPNYKDCKTINDAFLAKSLPLYVAYYRRSLPRFNKIKLLLEANQIGSIRTINWRFCKPANAIDLSGNYNWRTDSKIAPGGYFDDLASHGLDLFAYLLGDITQAAGMSENQQNLYTAKDAISAIWKHETGVMGSAFWNFGAYTRTDIVEIIGDTGKIEFSVFREQPIKLLKENASETFTIDNPKHIQLYHALNIKKELDQQAKHPSTGTSAAKTAWVMDNILGNT